MRALSIRQPHAERILRGTKTAEYRSRPTGIRERVYIYASLTPATPAGAALPHGRVGGDRDAGRPHRAIPSVMDTDPLTEAYKLRPSDRRHVIEALADTLSDADIPVTAQERALLDARNDDLEQNPCAQGPCS